MKDNVLQTTCLVPWAVGSALGCVVRAPLVNSTERGAFPRPQDNLEASSWSMGNAFDLLKGVSIGVLVDSTQVEMGWMGICGTARGEFPTELAGRLDCLTEGRGHGC